MFITFEGPDGSGKTTILRKLVKELKSRKWNIVATREPGPSITEINRQIRKIIINNKSTISPMTEAILFSADRRIHLDKIIIPALKTKKIVVCDRYFDSTFAYQGSGRKLGVDKMIKLQENITDDFYPDVTFYFDISVDKAIERLKSRDKKNYFQRSQKRRFEAEGKEFIEAVIKGYKEVINKDSRHRFILIDASKPEQEVYKQVLSEFIRRVTKT